MLDKEYRLAYVLAIQNVIQIMSAHRRLLASSIRGRAEGAKCVHRFGLTAVSHRILMYFRLNGAYRLHSAHRTPFGLTAFLWASSHGQTLGHTRRHRHDRFAKVTHIEIREGSVLWILDKS